MSAMIFLFDQLKNLIDIYADKPDRYLRRKAFKKILEELKEKLSGAAKKFRAYLIGYALGSKISIFEFFGQKSATELLSAFREICSFLKNRDTAFSIFKRTISFFKSIVENYVRPIISSIREKAKSDDRYARLLRRIEGFVEGGKDYYNRFSNTISDIAGPQNSRALVEALDYMGMSAWYYGYALSKIEALEESEKETLSAIRETLNILRHLRKFLRSFFAALDIIPDLTNHIERNTVVDPGEFMESLWLGTRLALASEGVTNIDVENTMSLNLQDIEELQNAIVDAGSFILSSDILKLKHVFDSYRKKLERGSRCFSGFVNDMQLVLQLKRIGAESTHEERGIEFLSTTSRFLGALIMDIDTALGTPWGLTASNYYDHKYGIIRGIANALSNFEKEILFSNILQELTQICFSIYLKLLQMKKDVDARVDVSEAVSRFVDSLTDYEVAFLVDLGFGFSKDTYVSNQPINELRCVFQERFLEYVLRVVQKLKPRKGVGKIIKSYVESTIGLEGKIKRVIEDHYKQHYLRGDIDYLWDNFKRAFEEKAYEITLGKKQNRLGVLCVLALLSENYRYNIRLEKLSPTLLRTIGLKMAFAGKIELGSWRGIKRAIMLSVILNSPISYEDLKIVKTVLDALYFAGEQHILSGECNSVDDLLEKLQQIMNFEIAAGHIHRAMDIKRIICKMLYFRRAYGDSKVLEILKHLGLLVESVNNFMGKAVEISRRGLRRGLVEDYIEKIANSLAEMLRYLGRSDVYSGTLPREVEYIEKNGEIEAIIARIAGFTVIIQENYVSILPYATYPMKNQRGEIIGVRFAGDIHSVTSIVATLYRQAANLLRTLRSLGVEVSVASPTYPGIHSGAKIGPDGKILRGKRFITWVSIGLSTIEKQIREELIQALNSIAEDIGSGDANKVKKKLRKLRNFIDNNIRGSAVWFVERIIEGVLGRIEKLLEVKNGKTALERMNTKKEKTSQRNLKESPDP